MAEATATTDLAALIMGADEGTWRKLSSALGVTDRQVAVDLVASNPSAAAKAREVLGVAPVQPDSVLSSGPSSLLSGKPKAPASRKPLSGLMYGSSSGAQY